MEKVNSQSWYILFVRGGRERKIIDNIFNLIKSNNFDHLVSDIKFIKGESVSSREKNLLPGYIFINCELSNELLSLIYETPDVISFLNHKRGDFSTLPIPLSQLEVNNFLALESRKEAKPSLDRKLNNKPKKEVIKKIPFNIGDLILIKDGFFKDSRGFVTKIDNRKNALTINVDFFGRSTPVSVNFSNCEKI